AETDVKHIYTAELPDPVRTQGSSVVIRPTETLPDVWHTLEFKNTADMPLTTAPATVMQESEVIGQDTISYTAAGGQASLTVNKALSIRIESAAEIKSRTPTDIKDSRGRVLWDKIVVEGVMEILNQRPENSSLRLGMNVTGTVLSSDGDPEISVLPKGLNDRNDQTRVIWRLDAPSGKKVKLTYQWEMLAPARGN
ncbi:MAG: hypothetical protein ACYTG5_21655, partial [Planctomycetota bacterium]